MADLLDDILAPKPPSPATASPAAGQEPSSTMSSSAPSGDMLDQLLSQRPASGQPIQQSIQEPQSEVSASAPPSSGGDMLDQMLAQRSAPSAAAQSSASGQKPVINYEERFGEGESFLSRPLTTYFGIPEYREGAGGIEKGVEKTLSALTSPVSLGLLIATGGTSAIADAGAAW